MAFKIFSCFRAMGWMFFYNIVLCSSSSSSFWIILDYQKPLQDILLGKRAKTIGLSEFFVDSVLLLPKSFGSSLCKLSMSSLILFLLCFFGCCGLFAPFFRHYVFFTLLPQLLCSCYLRLLLSLYCCCYDWWSWIRNNTSRCTEPNPFCCSYASVASFVVFSFSIISAVSSSIISAVIAIADDPYLQSNNPGCYDNAFLPEQRFLILHLYHEECLQIIHFELILCQCSLYPPSNTCLIEVVLSEDMCVYFPFIFPLFSYRWYNWFIWLSCYSNSLIPLRVQT